jgi:amidase/aspartyl-tRNA(Asn)/glutamyl-tRNA(Gln) amidotransferase subunit A
MADEQRLTTDTVESLAARVGVDATQRSEEIRAAISGSLDGYARLLDRSGEWAPAVDRSVSVTRDPDDGRDPHNAFLSRFELAGRDGPADDLTLAVKDNIAVGGAPLTCGSAVFADAVPGRDAAVVDRLLDAGATVVGKTNMDEMAYGPTGETSVFGPASNPVVDGRVTGGSSSGSAAAVAGGHADAALGTDTGGSVRIPAAFCGLVGVKPTWGLVPLEGVVELAYTLDHVGALTPDVRTAARVLDVLADDDCGFATAAAEPPALDTLTIGVVDELFGEYVSATVERTVRDHVDGMAAAGATVREVSVPLVDSAVGMWNAIVNVEFSQYLAAGATPLFRRRPVDPAWHRDAVAGLDDPERSFGSVVQRKAVEGAYLLDEGDGSHYAAARNGCRALAEQFDAALAECDVLVGPTMATEPIERGTWNPDGYSSAGEDAAPPMAVNTRPANLAGVPAVSVPAGRADTDPIGIQFVGAADDDATVLAAAAAFERFRDG